MLVNQPTDFLLDRFNARLGFDDHLFIDLFRKGRAHRLAGECSQCILMGGGLFHQVLPRFEQHWQLLSSLGGCPKTNSSL